MRLGLGISITQDLSVVLMLLMVPMLSGGNVQLTSLFNTVWRAALVVAIVITLARVVLPLWMHRVLQTRSRELFLLFLLVMCLGTAWLTLRAGLSIGLGAFLVGLAIAESGYSHHTLSEVSPFRDLLVSLFFLSTGMLLELHVVWSQAVWVLTSLVFVIVVKTLSGLIPVMLAGYPLRIAVVVGLAIAQIGEFAFVLAHEGARVGLVPQVMYQSFLATAVLSMMVSPLLVQSAPALAAGLCRWRWVQRWDAHHRSAEDEQDIRCRQHVIIAGYGLNGRNVADTLQACGLPFVVLEMNPDTVQAARRRGEPVYFGDCTRADLLKKLQIEEARGLVLAVSDPQATRQAVQVARWLNPHVHIIARTRFVTEIEPLKQLGANVVISEEFETSLEVLAATLEMFHVPEAEIRRRVNRLRAGSYRALREQLSPGERRSWLEDLEPSIVVETCNLPDTAPAVGRSLRDLDLRNRTGATVLAVRRGASLFAVPAPSLTFQSGDTLVIAGETTQVAQAMELLLGTSCPELTNEAPAAHHC
ncbi:MAG: potassium transporter KefB [Planctomycetaceae bacterium]|nr:MAG: potassium transporter KefB [Planctomycetaceae bacterium]